MTAEHKYEMTISLQIVEHLGLNLWYKISIAPEAYRKPRRLCLFLL